MAFVKGQSGNPKGRKKGSSQKTQRLADLAKSHAEPLLQKAIELALGGDVVMIKFFLGRLLPDKLPPAIELPSNIDKIESVRPLSVELFKALASQQLTPDEFSRLMGALKDHRENILLVELTEKLGKHDLDNAMNI